MSNSRKKKHLYHEERGAVSLEAGITMALLFLIAPGSLRDAGNTFASPGVLIGNKMPNLSP